LFKDKVKSFSCSPAEGEKFEFTASGEEGEVVRQGFGKKSLPEFKPSYRRATGFIIIGVIAVLFIGGIVAFML